MKLSKYTPISKIIKKLDIAFNKCLREEYGDSLLYSTISEINITTALEEDQKDFYIVKVDIEYKDEITKTVNLYVYEDEIRDISYMVGQLKGTLIAKELFEDERK